MYYDEDYDVETIRASFDQRPVERIQEINNFHERMRKSITRYVFIIITLLL